jgi:hypothetical protein
MMVVEFQLLYLIVDTHLILYLHHLVGCCSNGSNDANLSSTQASFIPSNLPKIMSDFGLFIAKVILDKVI